MNPPSDNQLVPGASLDDLDLSVVQRHLVSAHERGRYQGPLEPLTYLQRQQCVVPAGDMWHPTLAGMLAFAPDVERLISASGVDIAQFSSKTTRSDTMVFLEQVRGTLFQIIDRVTDLLWDRTDHSFRFDGAQRIEEHAYPRVVVRELTVNALCHRDWTLSGARVRIQLRPQQIEWISPGGLPAGVTLENLLEAQYSRNPTLTAILFQAGYIESLGLGMDTVFGTLHDEGRPPPQMRNAAHAFTIGVTGQSVTQTRAGHASTDRKVALLALIDQRGSLTISDLETITGWQRRTIQRDLQTLITQGVIEVIGSTNMRHYRRLRTASSGEANS